MKNFNSPSRGAGLSVVIFVSLLLAACDPSLGSRDSLPPEQAEQAPLGQAEDEEPEVDPDTGLPVFSDCAALQAESDWCLTFRGRSGSALSIVGLDSGQMCDVLPLELDTEPPSSFGVVGTQLFACDPGAGSAWRLDLLTGERLVVEPSEDEQHCQAATAWAGRPVTQHLSDFEALQVWERFEDIGALEPQDTIHADLWASRFAVAGDQLLSAWHSTDTVEIFSLPGGDRVSTVVTEGQDGWVLGLALSPAGELVTVHQGDELTFFDPQTGDFLRSVVPEDELNGLSCYPPTR